MKTKIPPLKLEDFHKWLSETETTYASQLPLKKLTVSMSGSLKVYHNGELVLYTGDPELAIMAYNQI